MYGVPTDVTWDPLTPMFYYMWGMVISGQFQRTRDERDTIKRWLAHQLFINGEDEDLVLDPRGLITANLTFKAKFYWLLFLHLHRLQRSIGSSLGGQFGD